MRSVSLFLAGILVGSAIQGASGQTGRGSLALNHVAISVPDLDEGIERRSRTGRRQFGLRFVGLRSNRTCP